ncbi:PREDICTED: nucleoside diphosphate-linked moiety X motif 19, mitochondrial, partial [Mandrillus leucophaeus]|uniref:nucleoside diphosphate-linked moiety X motif 19, mitochondrial n=1 Tax=Mandrillus leucophaeus TaxID=9568 RepID=UPI0005F43762
ALHNWSAWLTPFSRSATRRFDTAFFLCCLREPPPVYPDLAEVVGYQWSSPSETTESFLSKEIWLAPPQFYEVRRLANFASFSDLHKFCLGRALEGLERWLPIVLLTADGMVHLLPGDELYLEDSDFLENLMSTEKKTEEIMKEGKQQINSFRLGEPCQLKGSWEETQDQEPFQKVQIKWKCCQEATKSQGFVADQDSSSPPGLPAHSI